MNLTDPRFKWFPAASHSDPDLFRQRQRERMKAAQAQQKPQQPVPLTTKRKTA